MRGFERRGVRQYSRSDEPRMRWTEKLHRQFIEAVGCLGGPEEATPKRILQLMGVKGVSISHIKSHLQMYRTSSINNRSSSADASVNRHQLDHHCVDASRDGNNTAAAPDSMIASSCTVLLRGAHHSSPPYQIPSIEEIFRSWEQSKGLLPWNYSMLITPQKATGRPCHASKTRHIKNQTVAGCDLMLSIGRRWEEEAAAASSDPDGSSMTTEMTKAPVRDRADLNLDLNLDLAI